MVGWAGAAVIAAVAWYTFNVSRVQWRKGNKAGAIGAGLLALLVFVGCNLALFIVW